MIHARIRKRFAPGPASAAFELDIDLQAGPGVTILFGPSGAGKTLTLDSLAGFLRPDEGRITAGDAILFDSASGVHQSPQARRCGYVFQNYALFPHMTLRGNLEFAVEHLPRLERHRRVNEIIEKFRLGDVASRRPHELSGGQKQRCSIARALIGGPRILLLDEPAQGLDAPLRAELYQELRRVRADYGTPLLLVTHNVEESLELGDEMIVLRDGRIVQSGPPAKVLQRPATLEVARLLGLFCIIPAEIVALDPGANSSRLAVEGHELRGPYLPGRLKGDRVAIYIRFERIGAVPRAGKPAPNQIPAILERTRDTPTGVRLEFSRGCRVDMARDAFTPHAQVREWWLELPADQIRVL